MRRREVPAPLMARSVPGGSCIIGASGRLFLSPVADSAGSNRI